MSENQPIRSTWCDVADRLETEADPLRLLEILNLVGRRNWTFTVSFDCESRNVVSLQTTPALTRADAETLLAGGVAEFLNCDTLEYVASDGWRGEPLQLVAEQRPSNLFPVEPLPSPSGPPEMRLTGFFGSTLPLAFQRFETVEEALRERTWFGSGAFARYRHKVGWNVLGRRFVSQSVDRLTLLTAGKQSAKAVLTLADSGGNDVARLTAVLSEDVTHSSLYHSRFGRVRNTPLVQAFLQEISQRDDSWVVEIEEPALMMTQDRVLRPYGLLTNVLHNAVQAIRIWRQESLEYEAYHVGLDDVLGHKAANALKRRQEKAQRSAIVQLRTRELMCVPRAENEVVALLSKLETLNALPLHEFRLIEYTSRAGIDGLAHFRVNAGDATQLFATVEVEFEFENFFDHEHRAQQVSMVACWDFRGEPGETEGLSKVRPGLYRFTESEGLNSFWVLALSRIPHLSVKGAGA